jgi:hypothetical protein
MFKTILRHNKELAYESWETGIEYNHPIRAGFSWAQTSPQSPSFICIVGQEAESGTLRVLAEYENDNLNDLAECCGTLQKLYRISSWIAQKEGDFKSYEDALDKFAKDYGLSIYLNHPSIAWDLNLAIHIIRGKIQQNKLLLPKNGTLQKQIEKINREASLDEPEKMTVYGPILVLASVIFSFDSAPEEDDSNYPRDKWADDFDDRGEDGGWMGA